MTWTRSMLSLVFPLGFCPCGCAGGSPPGTAGRDGGAVRSLGERAATPRSWARALTSFYGPLYLAVTCSVLVLPDMLGSTANTFCVSLRDFRIQCCAWFNYEYMHCVSLRSLLKTLTHFLRAGGLREMTPQLDCSSASSEEEPGGGRPGSDTRTLRQSMERLVRHTRFFRRSKRALSCR